MTGLVGAEEVSSHSLVPWGGFDRPETTPAHQSMRDRHRVGGQLLLLS